MDGKDASRRKRRLVPVDTGRHELPKIFEPGDLVDEESLPELPVSHLEWLFEQRTEGERRDRWRAPYPEGVRVTIYGHEFLAQGLDLSMGGIAFSPVPHWVRKGDPVLVEMGEPARRLVGRVVWCRPMDDGTDRQAAGVHFASPDEQGPLAD